MSTNETTTRDKAMCRSDQSSVVRSWKDLIRNMYKRSSKLSSERLAHVPHRVDHSRPQTATDLDVDRVVKLVKSLRTSRPSAPPQKAITKQGRWKGFAEDPKRAKRAEKDSFGNLAAAVKEIVKASKLAGKDIHPFLQFENNARCEPSCPSQDEDTPPDSFLLCHGSSPSWRRF